MNLAFTETQRLIQQTARDFARKEVAPKAEEIDREARFPIELVRRLGELGFMGMFIPEKWGGSGLDLVSYALAMQEIAAACASTSVIMSINNSLICELIYRNGTDEQREKWLRPVASGRRFGCFCLSEPNAGSDAAAQRTRAEKRGEKWILNGTKNWITGGPHAETAVVFAMSDPAKGNKGITCFLIDTKSTPGFIVGKIEDKLGLSGSATCQIVLEDCEVPAENVLGEEGGGFRVAMSGLDGGRIGIACQAIGIARAAYEAARRYAKEREAFGRRIADFQAISFYLADMATRIEAAHLLTLQAASLKDRGEKVTRAASIAKLFASETANFVAYKALQIHGGNGYSREYPVERHFRDARITEIYEGTSEIQKLVISRQMLGR